jgi:hypothetical protein
MNNPTLFDRLIHALPLYFNKDPRAFPAFRIQYDGTRCTVTVQRMTLTTSITGGTGVPLGIDLKDETLASLAAIVNASPGYTATVLAEPTMTALQFKQVIAMDVMGGTPIDGVDSLLWRFMLPFSWAFEDLLEEIKDGLAQMTVRTAEEMWVALWGEQYYGGIYRRLNEGDRAYADRIMREAVRIRLNGKAIELIILEESGLEATVTNLHEQAWVVGVTNYGFLVGRKYARTTFEVELDGIWADLGLYVERNRAAGTLAFLKFSPVSETPIRVRFTPSVSIGGSAGLTIQLGAAQAADYLLPVSSTVLGSGSALFTLGGASLLGGIDALGVVAGMGIDDAWSLPA